MDGAHLLATPSRGRVTRTRAIAYAAVAPLACGFALGITYGNIGGVIEEASFLQRYHNPSDDALQNLAAIMQLGCLFGSILASWAADRFGRRRSIIFSMLIVALSGAVLLYPVIAPSSDSLTPLFLGRFLSGFGGGVACATVPLHVSEVAPAAHRGAIEASFQLAIELGILCAYSINLAATGTPTGWCYSLAAALPPASCFLVWAWWALPESPRFLVLHERDDDDAALRTLARLRTSKDDLALEIDAIRTELFDPHLASGSWGELLKREHRLTVFVAITVLMLQVGTGIDFVTVYAPRLFGQLAGGGNGTAASNSTVLLYTDDEGTRSQLMYTLLVGIVFVIVTPFAVASVDRCGRRVLLLLGGGGMTLSLAGLAFGYAAVAKHPESRALPLLCVVLLLVYVGCFSFSWGPVAWVLPSEMVAFRIRAKVVALGTVLNWVADYIVVGSFLSLTNAVGEVGGFAVYAAINALAFAFVLFLVPETKGRVLEARY